MQFLTFWRTRRADRQNISARLSNEFSRAVLADVLDALGHTCIAVCRRVRPLNASCILWTGRHAQHDTVASVPAKPYAMEMDAIDVLKPGEVLYGHHQR